MKVKVMKVKVMKVPSQATAHIPYSFTVELPDTGEILQDQHLPPPPLILLTTGVHIHEERYMQYIRMQNKQMIICENISGSAGDPH